MSRAAMAWGRVVVICSEIEVECRDLDQACRFAQIAIRAGMKVQQKPGDDDPRRREPGEAAAPILPVLPSVHRSGRAGDALGYAVLVRPLKL